MNRLELIKQGIENLSEEDFNKRFGDLIKKEKYFIPKRSDKYFLVNVNGSIGCGFYELTRDKNVELFSKLFKTKKEAEFQRDKQQFLLQMERDFLDNSDDIDWGNEYQYKYCLSIEGRYIELNSYCLKNIGVPTTTNLEWLRQYIEDNEENIKKYYFNIK